MSHVFDYMSRNNATLAGPNYTTAGKFGGAYEFDGVDDYIGFGDVLNMGTDNFTITAWIYPNSVTGERPIFNKALWWDESTKNKFPSEPKDKNLAWLSKDSALKMLELEGFVTKK